ncbi:MAG: hypothetical protein ACW9W3_04560 [Candidatus Nitrosopumilus sp. bin_68KS]
MKKCKLCGKDYEVGVKDCCSDECFKEDIQKRAKIATEDDVSHTKKISRDYP